jgi:hypothetical protein
VTSVVPRDVLGPDSAAVARYERLRRHVLGEAIESNGAPGLALLMRRGMSACMAATDEATTASPAPTCDADVMLIDHGLRGEIARVMVAMAIGATAPQEVHA